MENKYVILDSNNKYVNSVIWNGDLSVWQPPTGTTAVPFDEVTPDVFIPPVEEYTAEEWITRSSYTAMRLISLLDLEMKLAQSNKTANKMIAVRQWLNGLLQAFAIDPTPHTVWPEAPFSYEETVQEALTVLTT
jgi:hypothetical protein